MIDKIIVQYLAEHRRIIIPGFGAFIRDKASGDPVFVDLLRHDDGILRGEVREKMNVDDQEALYLISNHTARIRKMLTVTGSYPIAGWGTLHMGPDGKTTFTPLKSAETETTKDQVAEQEKRHENALSRPSVPAVEQARKEENAAPQVAQPDRSVPKTRKKHTDKTLLVAIIAAVIALAALLYGLFSTPDPVALDLDTATRQADTTAVASPAPSK